RCVDGEFVVATAEILHEGVPADDRLRGPVRAQAAHRSEPVLELTVIGPDWIVGMPLNVMPRRRDQLLDDGWVDRGGVSDDLAWRYLRHSQRSLEESAGRCRVTAGRDEYVDDLAFLVDGPVDIAPDAVDLHICFVDEPAVARCVASESSGVGQQWR